MFLEELRANSTNWEADGRVLRLKSYLGISARPAVIDAALDALAANTRVECLYIQNFEEERPLFRPLESRAGAFPRRLSFVNRSTCCSQTCSRHSKQRLVSQLRAFQPAARVEITATVALLTLPPNSAWLL